MANFAHSHVRPLEPQALAAAERVSDRAEMGFIARVGGIASRALSFASDRMRNWLGTGEAPSLSAGRVREGMTPWVRPWFELPSERALRNLRRHQQSTPETALERSPLSRPLLSAPADAESATQSDPNLRAGAWVERFAPPKSFVETASRPSLASSLLTRLGAIRELATLAPLLSAADDVLPDERPRVAAFDAPRTLGALPVGASQRAAASSWQALRRFVEAPFESRGTDQSGSHSRLPSIALHSALLSNETDRAAAAAMPALTASSWHRIVQFIGGLALPSAVAARVEGDASSSPARAGSRRSSPPVVYITPASSAAVGLVVGAAARRAERLVPAAERAANRLWDGEMTAPLLGTAGAELGLDGAAAWLMAPEPRGAQVAAPASGTSTLSPLLGFVDRQLGTQLARALGATELGASAPSGDAGTPAMLRTLVDTLDFVEAQPGVTALRMSSPRALPPTAGSTQSLSPAHRSEPRAQASATPRGELSVFIERTDVGASMPRGSRFAQARHVSPAPAGLAAEQFAAVSSLKAASLANDFLFGPTLAAALPPGVRISALTHTDWALLSLFPSTSTATEIAHHTSSHGAGAASIESVIPAPLRASALDTPRTLAWAMSGQTAPRDRSAQAAVAYRLPDGRVPRGSWIQPNESVAAPFEGVAPSLTAEMERAVHPPAPPLWEHLRPLPSRPAVIPRAALAPRPVGVESHAAPRATAPALEFIAPFLEAARARSGAGTELASGGSRVPLTTGRPSDEATRSLVTAVAANASSSNAPTDRLNLADLTLISVIAGADQIAASHGEASAPGSDAVNVGADGSKAGGASISQDMWQRVDEVAEEVKNQVLAHLEQTQGIHKERAGYDNEEG